MTTFEIADKDSWLYEWENVMHEIDIPLDGFTTKVFMNLYARRTEKIFFSNAWVRDTLYTLDALNQEPDLDINIAKLTIMFFGIEINKDLQNIPYALSESDFFADDCLKLINAPTKIRNDVTTNLALPFWRLAEEPDPHDQILADALMYWISEAEYGRHIYKLRRDFSHLPELNWNACLANLVYSLEGLDQLYHTDWLRGSYETNALNNLANTRMQTDAKLRELTPS